MRLKRSHSLCSIVFPVLLVTIISVFSAGAEEMVTVYDDFDDGRFGRSEYRSVLRSVKLSAFARSETLPVLSPALDEESFLTAVVLSGEVYNSLVPLMDDRGRILYSRQGLEFVFSLEKPGPAIYEVIEEYYSGTRQYWLEAVTQHYKENYVIRIHSAENIFEPWNDTITYTEALLMATAVGDRDQWLWGIHDGLNLLFP